MTRFLLLALALVALPLGACVHVHPYEREDLARPSMDAAREGSEMRFLTHIHDSREAATGGSGSTGGGCGCN
jgi:hypothetical protein